MNLTLHSSTQKKPGRVFEKNRDSNPFKNQVTGCRVPGSAVSNYNSKISSSKKKKTDKKKY